MPRDKEAESAEGMFLQHILLRPWGCHLSYGRRTLTDFNYPALVARGLQ